MIAIGDLVAKRGGDYSFAGTVVAAFEKRSGAKRFVVEDERGMLFIFNETQLTVTNESQLTVTAEACDHDWIKVAPGSAFEMRMCALCGREDSK